MAVLHVPTESADANMVEGQHACAHSYRPPVRLNADAVCPVNHLFPQRPCPTDRRWSCVPREKKCPKHPTHPTPVPCAPIACQRYIGDGCEARRRVAVACDPKKPTVGDTLRGSGRTPSPHSTSRRCTRRRKLLRFHGGASGRRVRRVFCSFPLIAGPGGGTTDVAPRGRTAGARHDGNPSEPRIIVPRGWQPIESGHSFGHHGGALSARPVERRVRRRWHTLLAFALVQSRVFQYDTIPTVAVFRR
jgi:hypothetical protein